MTVIVFISYMNAIFTDFSCGLWVKDPLKFTLKLSILLRNCIWNVVLCVVINRRDPVCLQRMHILIHLLNERTALPCEYLVLDRRHLMVLGRSSRSKTKDLRRKQSILLCLYVEIGRTLLLIKCYDLHGRIQFICHLEEQYCLLERCIIFSWGNFNLDLTDLWTEIYLTKVHLI